MNGASVGPERARAREVLSRVLLEDDDDAPALPLRLPPR